MKLVSFLIAVACVFLPFFLPPEFLPLSAGLISAATVAVSFLAFGDRFIHRVRLGFALISGVIGSVAAPAAISYAPEKWEFGVLFICGVIGYAASVEEFKIISPWLKKSA